MQYRPEQHGEMSQTGGHGDRAEHDRAAVCRAKLAADDGTSSLGALPGAR